MKVSFLIEDNLLIQIFNAGFVFTLSYFRDGIPSFTNDINVPESKTISAQCMKKRRCPGPIEMRSTVVYSIGIETFCGLDSFR